MTTTEASGVERYHQALRATNLRVSAVPGLTPREREEGYTYVAGMAQLAIQRAFICADTNHPRFVSCINPFSRWGLENVDNLYLCADIRHDVTYLIRGNVGACADVVYETLNNMVGDDGRSLGEGVASIDFDTLRIERSGDYTICIGPHSGESPNFLATGGNANTVFLRKTINQWEEADAGWQTIERIGATAPPDRFDAPGDTDRRWNRAADLLANQVGFLEAFADNWRDGHDANTISTPSTNGSGYLPGQYNSAGRFELEPGRGLMVSLTPVQCRHMSVAAGHSRWFCSFDGGESPSQLNREQSHLSSDGRFHYVIAAQDPGVPNWIDTSGHDRGFLFCRWQGVNGGRPPTPAVALVKLADVKSELPDDTPHIGSEERVEIIRRRRLALDRRYAL